MNRLVRIWKTKDLRKKILFTLFILAVYRIASHITLPGVDVDALQSIYEGEENAGGVFNIYAAFTGGSMQTLSIVMMGLAPYINASIIVQLLTVAIPKLEALSKEGEQGRKKINSITRWLTLPLALLQSYGMLILATGSIPGGDIGIDVGSAAEVIPAMIIISAGTVFLMWLGELITEKGIGNGISLIIFAGIVTAIPNVFISLFALGVTGDRMVSFIAFLLVTVALLVAVVLFTEGHRAIPISHTSRTARGEQSTLPIKILQAGMIPIIFAVSLLTFPTVLAGLLSGSDIGWAQSLGDFWSRYFDPNVAGWTYIITYFVLIVLFSFFYVSITFNPETVAENLQKRGGFIPGVRPGRETAEFLAKVSSRMNLWGGTFLAFIAIVPLLFTRFTDLSTSDMIISGSGLIIVVGVVLELIRQVDSQLVMHDYERIGR
jgi:preprotein translocase subunit SecY